MADKVLSNIASSLLSKLSSAMADEFSLLWNSKKDIEKLRNTISTIVGVLPDAERRQTANMAVQEWISRLKDEIYEADDLFDELDAAILRKRVSNNKFNEVLRFFSMKNQFAFLIRITHKVKDLRKRLDDIAKDINQFKFLVGGAVSELESTLQIREQTHSFVRENFIIGREKEKQKIIEMLIDESYGLNQPVSVVSIIGIGGLGKTALAQFVYNDKQVEDHFAIRLWACVDNFSVVLEKILASGSSHKLNGLEHDQLAHMLMNRIRGSKFLLVLDDVWDEIRENWLKLKILLDVGAQGSKVIVTTRSEIVATNFGSNKTKLRLGGLSDSDAWSLFVKMAFDPCESNPDHGLELLGRQIIKKCGNVPLAIRCVGSFLYTKDKKQWLSILNNDLANVIPEDQNLIKKVLMISFNALPASMKHCFAYCSLYPKDYVFSRNSLVHLWMAQGFIDQKPHEIHNLEDLGEMYITFLINRCFFQDVEENEFGEVKTFKIHDLLHDLAIDVAGNESLFINRMDLDKVKGRAIRHLAYGCDVDFSNGVELPQKCLRTLLFHERRVFNHVVVLDRLILCLENLRMLDLSYLQLKMIPNSVGALVHLRYLDLSQNQELMELPNSICDLQYLQTLDLSECCRLVKLPKDLHKLICLRHLVIGGCKSLTRMPLRLGEMTSLVTLSRFVVEDNISDLRNLAELNNLSGRLVIKRSKYGPMNFIVDDIKDTLILKRKAKLQELELDLSCCYVQLSREAEAAWDCTLDLLQPSNNLASVTLRNFGGTRCSKWISSLKNLTELDISFCPACLHLPPLSELPQLKKLSLFGFYQLEYMEDDITCYQIGPIFPALEVLSIGWMPRLKGWWRQLDAQDSGNQQMIVQSATTNELGHFNSAPWFHSLRKVDLSNCPKLVSFPSFPCAKTVMLTNVDQKLLRPSTMMNVADVSTSAITSSSVVRFSYPTLNQAPYFQLEMLAIHNMRDLVSLSEEWMMQASTLRSLCIFDCPELESISPQHLAALETLTISNCPKLDLLKGKESLEIWSTFPRLKCLALDFSNAQLMRGLYKLTALEFLNISGYKPPIDVDRILWISPPNLKSLTVSRMNNVADYTEVLKQCNAIECLSFNECEVDGPELDAIPWETFKNVHTLYFSGKMESLPERIFENLPLLQVLHLVVCRNLKSLPSWVNRLQSLRIYGCQLLDKYKKPMGECWPEIRHITARLEPFDCRIKNCSSDYALIPNQCHFSGVHNFYCLWCIRSGFFYLRGAILF